MSHVQWSLRSLLSLIVVGVVMATSPVAEAQRGDPAARSAARTQRAQLRQVSRGQGPAATRARAQRVSALLGRAGARPSPLVRRYVRTALGSEVSRLLAAHEQHAADGSASIADQVDTAARLSMTVRRARRVQADAIDDATADGVELAVGQARWRAQADRNQSAVELETDLTPEIIDAMTTEDGTVGPILREGGRSAPEFLRQMAGEGGDVNTIQFDSLSREQRVDLLRSQSQGRYFFSNRRIPGLRFRRQIANRREDGSLRVANPRMRGAQQQPGATVDVTGVLMEHVEYMGPRSVENVDGVEIHVRQTGPAGRNLEDANTIEQLLNIYSPARHQHVTARVPPGVRGGDPIERAQFVDFYRRVNLVAELDTVLDGVPLHRVSDGGATYFDYLRGDGLATLARYLRGYAQGNRRGMGNSTLKMAAVGFRTGDLYDNPELVGFEARTLSTDGDVPEHHVRLVDAIQRGLVGRRYGIPRRAIARWYQANIGLEEAGAARDTAEDSALSGLHFNRPIQQMLDHLPEGLDVPEEARQQLLSHAEDNYALKLLVHDFTHDPALAGNTEALGRIRGAQQAWIFRLAQGRDTTDVAGHFVADSGLHEVFARSIGM